MRRFSLKKKFQAGNVRSVPSGAMPTMHAVPVGRSTSRAVAAVRALPTASNE
ncbi:Uncharacterised protein [Mycobacteroides abscessus subsp. abscessus]|nr:Uncharacterised protein [Mycobacteroides abscessus subsp. abscessus]